MVFDPGHVPGFLLLPVGADRLVAHRPRDWPSQEPTFGTVRSGLRAVIRAGLPFAISSREAHADTGSVTRACRPVPPRCLVATPGREPNRFAKREAGTARMAQHTGAACLSGKEMPR